LPAIVLKAQPGFLLHWLLTGRDADRFLPFGAYWRSLANVCKLQHNWQTIWLIRVECSRSFVIIPLFFRDTNQIQTKPGLDIEEPSAQTEI